MLLMNLGENLWRRFLPKYLQSLGAPITAIGLFGTAEDFLDGVYQYPGGWIADRYGRRFALVLFTTLAALGYAIYWALPAWPLAFAGLAFVMAWTNTSCTNSCASAGLRNRDSAMAYTVGWKRSTSSP